MNWETAIAEVESPEFDARLNVVSGLRLLFDAASNEPAVKTLYNEMQSCGIVGEEVLGRIYDMARLSVDPRYENPSDTAMAILLWLILYARLEYADLAARYIDQAQQCWYAKKLARSIMVPTPVASGDASTGVQSSDLKLRAAGSDDAMINMQPFATDKRPVYGRTFIISTSASA